MIVSINEVELMKSNVKDFVEAIEFLIGPVSHSRGCLRSDIFYNKNEITTVIIYHEWSSMDLFQRYLCSDLFKQILSLYEMSLKKPLIKIFECDSIKGFSWIESVMLQTPLEQAKIDYKYI